MSQNNRDQLLRFEKQLKHNIQRRPSDPKLFLNYIQVKCQLSKLDDVKQLIKSALSSDRFDGSTYFYCANIVLGYRLKTEALLLYSKSIEKEKSNAGAYINRGCIFHDQFEYELAVADFDSAININAEIPEAYKNKANSLEAMHRYQDAINSMLIALKIRKNYTEAHLGLASLYRKSGEYEKAKLIYLDHFKLQKDPLNILTKLASLPAGVLNASEIEEFLEMMSDESISKDPYSWHFARARLFALTGRVQSSFQEICHAKSIRHERQGKLLEDWRDKQNQIRNHILAWSPRKPIDTVGEDTPELVMILGPSRSGKSLLETALSPDNKFLKGLEGRPATIVAQNIRELYKTFNKDKLVDFRNDVVSTLLYASDVKGRDVGQIITVTNPFFIEIVSMVHDLHPKSKFIFIARDKIENASEVFSMNYKDSAAFSDTPASSLDYVMWYNDLTDILKSKIGARAIKLSFDAVIEKTCEVETQIGQFLNTQVQLNLPGSTQNILRSKYSDFFTQSLGSAVRA